MGVVLPIFPEVDDILGVVRDSLVDSSSIPSQETPTLLNPQKKWEGILKLPKILEEVRDICFLFHSNYPYQYQSICKCLQTTSHKIATLVGPLKL